MSPLPARTAPRSRRKARRSGRPPAGAPGTSADILLVTAETLLRREGPSVRIADIAAAAGVTKPIVYHHIGNKAALASALADRLADRVGAAIERAVAKASTPREGIDRLLEAYLDTVQRDSHVLLYVSAGSAGVDQVAESLRLADRSAGRIAEGLAQLRRDQGADPAVARTWALAVIGMLHFVTLAWIREPDLSAGELGSQLGELLWSGVGGAGVARGRRS